MRYFIPIFVEEGNTKNFFQFLVAVIPDIGVAPVGFQETIPLLPYPDRMRLDPGKIFEVFYGKNIHIRLYKAGEVLFNVGGVKFKLFGGGGGPGGGGPGGGGR